MAKAPEKIKELSADRPKRAKPSAQESLQRMEKFEQERKEKFVATIREGKD